MVFKPGGTNPIVLQLPDLSLRLDLSKLVKHLNIQKFISDFGDEPSPQQAAGYYVGSVLQIRQKGFHLKLDIIPVASSREFQVKKNLQHFHRKSIFKNIGKGGSGRLLGGTEAGFDIFACFHISNAGG